MKALASLTSVLALVACASAAQQSYFFHHSATPVAVPGGTSSFFLDDTAPAAAAPTLEGDPSHRHTTYAGYASYPRRRRPSTRRETLGAANGSLRVR